MPKSLIILIIISLILRIFGLNWDQGFHLHPDERFLTMVATSMRFSGNYFDTHNSTLNPHNLNYDFYVYGTWPVIFTKVISVIFSLDNYDTLTLTGRILSALFDTGTVLLVYLTAFRLFKKRQPAFLSALFYSFAVLPIQLSHFFAVDTFLVFSLTLTLYLLVSNASPLLLGIAFGLALAAKISAILFLPIIFFKILLEKAGILKKIKYIFPLIIGLLISIRIFYPYLFDGFSLNQKVINNWKTLKSFDVPGYFPPGVQWINSTPLNLYLNTAFFGLGLPLGVLFVFSFFKAPKIIKKYSLIGLLYLWITGLFIYQGTQFAKPLRYLYPAYPAIAIISGYFLSYFRNWKLKIVYCLVIVAWSLGFMSIYSKPHSRVQASDWILKNIPSGSKISCEYWDDCLPLYGAEKYQVVQISPYDKSKLPDISNIDYLIFSSNRLYGGIPSAPEIYPETSQFYKDLFNEKLGFKKIAEFTSRPNFRVPNINLCLTPPYFNYGFVSNKDQYCNQTGISLVDDYAEESFTVYDHPKVIIFEKI